MYGLSWVELGLREPADGRAVALGEARWALRRLDSPSGRAPFSPDLVPPYGVFYQGWTNWLRGGALSLQPAGQRDPAELRRFAADSAALGRAFDASGSPFLAAYPEQAWPVDSTVAVASLRLHDTLLPPRFAGTVERWLRAVRERLDPRTGRRRAGQLRRAGRPADRHPVDQEVRLRPAPDRRRVPRLVEDRTALGGGYAGPAAGDRLVVVADAAAVDAVRRRRRSLGAGAAAVAAPYACRHQLSGTC
ncbi:hypothetical protein [Nonomuraea cavernae]|uniref:hypothetical protein n=1 Tax=Nonomuraea cavernae TaxID=2045107 RepID=UPI001663B9DA|nr:hypothetical protein [Nonomuraea cavernae]MCA2189514.1 hypothetical protein [Nonomuraea cavernae]